MDSVCMCYICYTANWIQKLVLVDISLHFLLKYVIFIVWPFFERWPWPLNFNKCSLMDSVCMCNICYTANWIQKLVVIDITLHCLLKCHFCFITWPWFDPWPWPLKFTWPTTTDSLCRKLYEYILKSSLYFIYELRYVVLNFSKPQNHHPQK